jgi:cytoskeleton protein RodZ
MSEPAASPGARLKSAREHRGLSAQKAADEMHLDRWVIEALEADDYQRIGPTVYAKGHLKKYAALLGLPAAELLAGYESRMPAPGAAAASAPTLMHAPRAAAQPARNLNPQQIAVSAAVVLLLLGVLWWKPWQQRGPLRHVADVPAAVREAPAHEAPLGESPVSIAPEQAAGAAPIPTAAASPAMVREAPSPPAATLGAPAPSPAQSAAAPAADTAVPGAGRARLRLSFSADSWVDVRDATGRRTYAGTGLANSVKTIAGAAPMRVYLAFGSGVQLEINDRVVAIGPQFFAGDVARFEAGADGVLRRDSRSDPSRGDSSRGDPSHGVQASSARPTG